MELTSYHYNHFSPPKPKQGLPEPIGTGPPHTHPASMSARAWLLWKLMVLGSPPGAPWVLHLWRTLDQEKPGAGPKSITAGMWDPSKREGCRL